MLLAPAALAHVTSGKRWYFAGKTYTNDTPKKPKDPVNWIFYGGGGDVTNTGVGAHIENDWNDPAEGSVMADRFCKSSQRMVWSSLTGTQISDKQDFHRMTNCAGRQFHTRMWDDWEHSKITTHARYSWVVGGIHHEKLRFRFPCCVTHSIDRDWDTVRVQAVKAMKTHCTYRRWRYHPGARGRFQGYFNSGYVARISLRHRSSGCQGA